MHHQTRSTNSSHEQPPNKQLVGQYKQQSKQSTKQAVPVTFQQSGASDSFQFPVAGSIKVAVVVVVALVKHAVAQVGPLVKKYLWQLSPGSDLSLSLSEFDFTCCIDGMFQNKIPSTGNNVWSDLFYLNIS